ncbi:MAG: hypothetical protein IKD44_04900 [Lentisphaeria bacterium]|nr:hypothetical protein [Lentisphaeria bacterium]
MIKKILPAAVFVLCFCSADAKTFYVSNSGSDANSGSEKSPWKTIAFASKKAGPGDTVKILPGLYREQIQFTRSGKKGAPITFAGTRGRKGEFLTIVESNGTTLDKWVPAPEIAPNVWKTKVAQRPSIVMVDGKMIALINSRTMELKRRKTLPSLIIENDIWSGFGPKCKRIPGLDLLALDKNIKVKHHYFGKRQEYFWPVLNYVLSGWQNGMLYLRFANGSTPEKHLITAAYGEGFTVDGLSHVTFSDLHMRGSRYQIHVKGKSSFVTVKNCLLMHGGARVRLDGEVKNAVIKDNIMTAGFIRDDLFGLRSSKDMRGGLLYLIFKYIIGTSLSDDVGVINRGTGTLITGNIIIRGLIGVQAFGPGVELHSNVVREMSSVGIVTGPLGGGRFYENLVMNCGIPLRIHRIREKHRNPLRTEFHYRNLFVQAPHGGSNVFVHCSSMTIGDDVVNFEKDKKGKKVYKKNPPSPVDPGRFYIYHNTFWGGADGGYGIMVDKFARMFRTVMPFYFVNNIVKFSPRHNSKTLDLMKGNLFYLFAESAMKDKSIRDPGLYKINRSIGIVKHEKIWNKKSVPGLPDVTLTAGSPALECGIDVTKSRPGKAGRVMPALPGFVPGYFKGKAPAAGAFQVGESQEKFFRMHKKTEEVSAMLRRNPGK